MHKNKRVMETEIRIESIDSLWNKCDSYAETIGHLREELDYARQGLYQKLHELMGLVVMRIMKSDSPTKVVLVENNESGLIAVNMTEDEIIFTADNGAGIDDYLDSDIDVSVYMDWVKLIIEQYKVR